MIFFITTAVKTSNPTTNYVFSSIIHNCLPTFEQVLDPTLEEIHRFAHEELLKPILELSVIAEGNSAPIVRESGRGGNLMGQDP
jgi:hypothetical protein